MGRAVHLVQKEKNKQAQAAAAAAGSNASTPSKSASSPKVGTAEWGYQEFATPNKVDAGAYGETNQTRTNQNRVKSGLSSGRVLFNNPTRGNIDPRSAPQVRDPNDIRATTMRGDQGLGEAQRGLDMSRYSRTDQTRNVDGIRQAMGGPQPGEAMFNRGAGKAADLMRLAGSNANQAYGNASAGARADYGRAGLGQEAATREAGIRAARDMRDQADANVRAQASLASRGRGGAMGAALLNAQNNAATGMQNALVQGGRVMGDANRQAADIAAQRMMQANQNQNMANLQTAGAQERAGINAGMVGADMMSQGSELANAGNLDYLKLLNDATNTQRAQDLSQVGAATSMGGLGSNIDSSVTGADQFNANLGFNADTTNVNNAVNLMQGNQRNALANAQLGAGMMSDYTGMGIESEQFNRGMTARGAETSLGALESADDRGVAILNPDTQRAWQSSQNSKQRKADFWNTITGGVLSGGAALLGRG